MGIDPQQYIVGNELNSINPVTGQPEFFLKKIFKEAKKAVKKIAPYAGVIAAGFGAPWQAATGIGALGGLYGEGDIGGAIKGGLYGYGASKLLGEQGLYGQLPGGTEKGWLPGMRAGGKGIFAQSKEIADNKKEMLRLKTEGLEIADNKKFYDDLKEANKVLLEEGRFPNLSALPWYEQGALGLGATFGATDLLAMGEEDKDGDGYPDDWWDIQPKHPWGGNFAAPGVDYSANGGIINAYDNGGDVNAEEVQVAEMSGTRREKAIRISRMMYDDAIAMPSGPERDAALKRAHAFFAQIIPILQEANGGIINAYDNGGDVHPGTVDPRVESLIESRNELLGTDPRVKSLIDKRNELLKQQWGPTDEPDSRVKSLIESRNELLGKEGLEGGEIVTVYDTVEETIVNMTKSNLMRLMQEDPERYISPRKHLERIRDSSFISRRENLSGEEYTEDKYADGGIAHLAGGSFPRMSGAISGPGGPRDDMVPAMLSDGEFVMTADAVRNAGGGSRREGARRMYQLMNQLQGVA